MATHSVRQSRSEPRRSPSSAPPMRPDPDLVGNAEGNRKILESDRRAVQRALKAAKSGK